MSEPDSTPFAQTLRWLAAHTGFPASRLPDKAELLVLIATAAADEEAGTASRHPNHVGLLRNPNFASQIRHYTAQRRRVHLKSDNSAKT